jgi:hypothetical protein
MDPRLVELSESRAEIESLGQKLLDSGVQRFVTGHCTGVDAYMVLKSIITDQGR